MTTQLKHFQLLCPNCLEYGHLKAYSPMMDTYECSNCKMQITAQIVYQFNHKTIQLQEETIPEKAGQMTAVKSSKKVPRTMDDIYRNSVGELLQKLKTLAELRTKDSTEVPDHVLDSLFEAIFIQTDELLNVHYQGVNYFEGFEEGSTFKDYLDGSDESISASVLESCVEASKLDEELKTLYKQQLAKHLDGPNLFNDPKNSPHYNDYGFNDKHVHITIKYNDNKPSAPPCKKESNCSICYKDQAS